MSVVKLEKAPVVEAGFASWLDELPQAVLVTDASGAVQYVNYTAQDWLGISQSRARQYRLTDIFGEGLLASLHRQVVETSRPVEETDLALNIFARPYGLVDVSLSPSASAPGMYLCVLHHHPLTQEQKQQAHQHNALRAVQTMMATLAHEIKNPLLAITGAAQLLSQTAGAEDLELTRLIEAEARRIRDLIDRMDMLKETATMERQALNIHAVLDHVRKSAQAGFSGAARLEENYDPSLPPVAGNADLLVQVFLNLVKNAIEACTETGPRIILRTRYQQGVAHPVSREKLPVRVEVEDNGPGIPEHMRARLFDPFATTKHNGSGLGLAIVARIIADLGGVVTFETAPGRTVFSVSLPIAHEEVTP